MKNMWMVRAGEKAKYADEFETESYVGLNWEELGDFSQYDDVDKIKDAIRVHYPSNNRTIGLWAYMIEKLTRRIQTGDYVVTYNYNKRAFLVGEVVSDIEYQSELSMGNIRRVKWLGYAPKDYLNTQTKNTLGAISSLFEIKEESTRQDILDNVKKDLHQVQQEQTRSLKKVEKVRERDVHKYLVKYLYESDEFNLRAKTIYHEKSHKKNKGHAIWLHPDIVGAQFSFDTYSPEIAEIQKEMVAPRVILYSFELKTHISLSTLREYYFQAVSNSSWAHHGYLVVSMTESEQEISDSLLNELYRLNNMFGIGLISLNIDNLTDTEILIPARPKLEVDWQTVDMMKGLNPDFSDFLETIKDCLKVNKSNQEGWDEVI